MLSIRNSLLHNYVLGVSLARPVSQNNTDHRAMLKTCTQRTMVIKNTYKCFKNFPCLLLELLLIAKVVVSKTKESTVKFLITYYS